MCMDFCGIVLLLVAHREEGCITKMRSPETSSSSVNLVAYSFAIYLQGAGTRSFRGSKGGHQFGTPHDEGFGAGGGRPPPHDEGFGAGGVGPPPHDEEFGAGGGRPPPHDEGFRPGGGGGGG